LNDMLRASTKTSLDDTAPINAQECKEKLKLFMQGDSLPCQVKDLDRISGLRAQFKEFRKNKRSRLAVYHNLSYEVDTIKFRIDFVKNPQPTNINPVLEAFLAYRNREAEKNKVNLDGGDQ